ncbi:MAG: DUF6757 family protein [Halobacteriaceae archaeon]
MRCHYCDEPADLTVETGGVRVGLCEEHFRDRLEELSEDDMEGLRERFDVDQAE